MGCVELWRESGGNADATFGQPYAGEIRSAEALSQHVVNVRHRRRHYWSKPLIDSSEP